MAKQDRNTDGRVEREDRYLFGRRKAKPLSAHQNALLGSLLPKLAVDPDRDPIRDLPALFEHRPDAVYLEIGFGGGEHLVARALANPEAGFIGIEPFVNGIAKALVQVDLLQIENIRIFDKDASLLIGKLPDDGLAGIDLLYPDPWPKRRHWKRRFINRKNLCQIARILSPGGRLRFVSDHPGYVNWTLRHCLKLSDMRWTAKQAGDWQNPWPGWLSTRYEKKAFREGRSPAYLIFEKQAGNA